MKLDSATLVIVSAVIQIILVLVLLHAWRNRETYPGFAAWVAGTAAWSVGGIRALILPDLQPRIIPKGIGFGLLFLNPVLMLEGLRQFYGVRRRWTGLPLDLAIAAIATPAASGRRLASVIPGMVLISSTNGSPVAVRMMSTRE